jgi:hypothetical protein
MPAHRWDPGCSPPRDLVVPVRVDPDGKAGPSRGQAAGPRWRQSSPGVYVPVDTPRDVPEQRILEQSMRLPPGNAAVTGWAACRLHGARFHDGLERDGRTEIPVPLAVGHRGGVRRSPKITVGFEALNPGDWTTVSGNRLTTAERATFDAMRRRDDWREALVALDAAVAAEITSIERVTAFAQTRSGSRRIGVVRLALPYASEHSRSPNETRLRAITLVDAGIPSVHVDCPIYDRHGRLLGIADLLDEAAGLVIEFDGAEHRGLARHSRDAVKDDDLRNCALEVVRVTGPQLHDVPTLVRRLHAARSRARFLPPDQRTWVARPRPNTLDRRLREREELGIHMATWLDEQSG